MGSKFVEGRSVEFSKSYEESSQSTPIFFILSPGVDPLKDVEALGKVVIDPLQCVYSIAEFQLSIPL